MEKMSYHEFLVQVADRVHEQANESRYGQVLFNHLSVVRPDLALQIVGTRKDPYYCHTSTEINPEFWAFLLENW